MRVRGCDSRPTRFRWDVPASIDELSLTIFVSPDACDYLTGETIAMDGGRDWLPEHLRGVDVDADRRGTGERSKTGLEAAKSAAQCMRTITWIDDAVAAVGAELGYQLTGYWSTRRESTPSPTRSGTTRIHVDSQRAATESPATNDRPRTC